LAKRSGEVIRLKQNTSVQSIATRTAIAMIMWGYRQHDWSAPAKLNLPQEKAQAACVKQEVQVHICIT